MRWAIMGVALAIGLLSAVSDVLVGQETKKSLSSPKEKVGEQPLQEIAASPEQIALELLEATANGHYGKATESCVFVLKQVLPAAALKQTWQGLSTQYGKYLDHQAPLVESRDGSTLVRILCRFEQGTLEARISLNANRKVQGYFIAVPGTYQTPNYVNEALFESEEIQVGKGLLKLPGTLTLPKGEGKFAAVVLVQGSGPSDRDETIGPNKPFRDIAEGLASLGIAAVRYEKRTKHYPLMATLTLSSLTVDEETVHDAAAAVDWLRADPRIDSERIFVIGHSLGGWLLPRIYAAGKPIAGLVSLAGSARPLEDLVLEQVHYLAEVDGEVSPEESEQIEKVRQQVMRVKGEELSKTTPASQLPLSIPPAYWLDLRGYNAPQLAREIPARWLLLQGERDYQVIDKDIVAWEKGLTGHMDVTLKKYPKLNHLFMSGEGPCRPVEYFREANVAEVVIRDIAHWIQSPRS
jgi:dienelactone hydrolase